MTAINLLYVFVISALAAAGFLGLGSWGGLKMTQQTPKNNSKPDPPKTHGVVVLYSEEEKTRAEEGERETVDYKSIEKQAEDEFNKAFEDEKGKDKGIDFKNFQKLPKRKDFEKSLTDYKDRLAGLKKKLENPTAEFFIKPRPVDLKKFILPRPSDGKFPATIDSVGIPDFYWVDDSKAPNKGFWFSKIEVGNLDNLAKAPDKVTLVDNITIPCKLPTKAEWQAACRNQEIEQLDEPPFGNGEYLADGKVIGQSDQCTDEKLMSPLDPVDRRKIILGTIKVPEPSRQYLDDRTEAIAKERGDQTNPNYYKDYLSLAKEEWNRKFKADAEKKAEKETFAYRLVIEANIK